MTGWRSRRAAAAGALVVLLSAMTAGAARADGDFSFSDSAITESSGLFATSTRVVTVNDSGNDPILFLVSRLTGETVYATRFTPDPTVDVEGLSPGATPNEIWVGDIGDNNEVRSSVVLYRTEVPQPGVELPAAPRYRLRYSDGAHDAEALMIDGEGRVVIASKGAFSGKLYRSAGPPSLSRTTVLRPVARIPGLVTDGVLSSDGSVLYLRTYGIVAVYSYPGLDPLGTFSLPPQPQGEGLARDGLGHLLVSSEGVGEPVLRVEIPVEYRATPAATSGPSPSGKTEPPPPGEGSGGSWSETWLRWWPVGAGAAVVSVLLLSVRGARRRSRRTR